VEFEVLQDSLDMCNMMIQKASLAKYVGETMQDLPDRVPMEGTSPGVLEMEYDGPKKEQALGDRTDTVWRHFMDEFDEPAQVKRLDAEAREYFYGTKAVENLKAELT
jgi:5-formaminoimidazole-4-carboxamide-1-beta-D-ribofuranosyl 5'-monophosphate synthetase